MAAKIRWEMRNRKKRNNRPWTEEEEWIETQKKIVYNEETSSVDFRKKKVTEMSQCRRIETPEELKDSKIEIAIASVKSKLSNINEEYISEKCDQRGKILETNLTNDEITGLKSLKERIKNGEIMVAPTDKSGKLSVNTRDNYIASLESHVNNDIVITWEEKSKIENILNAHA